MAEAEEVVSDVARHATIYARSLWQKYRKPPEFPQTTTLGDVASRLDLFVSAVFGESYPIRTAQLPPRATLLSILFRHNWQPRRVCPVPATDGYSIWLPPDSGIAEREEATLLYRVMALQQVIRARRGAASMITPDLSPLHEDVFLLLEACAADQQLINLLPGLARPVDELRRQAAARRPPLNQFPAPRRPFEKLVRSVLSSSCTERLESLPLTNSPEDSLAQIARLIHQYRLVPEGIAEGKLGPRPMFRDWWTGEFRPVPDTEQTVIAAEPGDTETEDEGTPRGGRLARRPEERKPTEEEKNDDDQDGIWMVQADESHPHAEDPMGLQRPADRDEEISADEFGDMVSELPEARLVSTPGKPKEVLLSDDPPDARAKQELKAAMAAGGGFHYPEWDYRKRIYREPGAMVYLLSAGQGAQKWVDDTLAEHEAMLKDIRRRFEMLSAQRVRYRKQVDGDDIDLDAYTESFADFRAGFHMAEGLYQMRRTADRHMAITLLIDISGSTDSWVSANRRIIDVEREALLLVCMALEGLGEPYSVEAFSGEGPDAVTVRQVKSFDEPFSNAVALRISALEPQHYTRAGAAIRHATVGLMRQPAAHRLLLLLSDGKPNDRDDYEGRYGVEDMRQAVTEASLQGIFPFCLTIDRQAANYLPRVFGAHQYALLTKPERLTIVLLDWMKRLVSR